MKPYLTLGNPINGYVVTAKFENGATVKTWTQRTTAFTSSHVTLIILTQILRLGGFRFFFTPYPKAIKWLVDFPYVTSVIHNR